MSISIKDHPAKIFSIINLVTYLFIFICVCVYYLLYFIIGEELTSRKASEYHKLNAFRKFSLLWHVGRELAANSQNVGDMFYK